MMIRCGHCGGRHCEVATVRACAQGKVFVCDWLVERPSGEWNDFEPIIEHCGASAVITDRGFYCEAGHEHVDQQARMAEGWDYAEDAGEAETMARAGVEPHDMQGRIWMG
jgi:hypothetical protein